MTSPNHRWEMQCGEVQERLVALQDNELSPSERAHVVEHLRHCEVCTTLEAQLAAVTPKPHLEVPFNVQRSFHEALDRAVSQALDEEPLPLPRPSRWQRAAAWLRRDTEVPMAVVIAYAALLGLVLSWGIANWMTVHDLQTTPIASTPEIAAPDANARPITADQYRPASYSPDTDVLH